MLFPKWSSWTLPISNVHCTDFIKEAKQFFTDQNIISFYFQLSHHLKTVLFVHFSQLWLASSG